MQHGLAEDSYSAPKSFWVGKLWQITLNESCPDLCGRFMTNDRDSQNSERCKAWIKRSVGCFMDVLLEKFNLGNNSRLPKSMKSSSDRPRRCFSILRTLIPSSVSATFAIQYQFPNAEELDNSWFPEGGVRRTVPARDASESHSRDLVLPRASRRCAQQDLRTYQTFLR